jgi:hypothetical protein
MRFMSSNLELGPLENLSAKCGGTSELRKRHFSGALKPPSKYGQSRRGLVKACQLTFFRNSLVIRMLMVNEQALL